MLKNDRGLNGLYRAPEGIIWGSILPQFGKRSPFCPINSTRSVILTSMGNPADQYATGTRCQRAGATILAHAMREDEARQQAVSLVRHLRHFVPFFGKVLREICTEKRSRK